MARQFDLFKFGESLLRFGNMEPEMLWKLVSILLHFEGILHFHELTIVAYDGAKWKKTLSPNFSTVCHLSFTDASTLLIDNGTEFVQSQSIPDLLLFDFTTAKDIDFAGSFRNLFKHLFKVSSNFEFSQTSFSSTLCIFLPLGNFNLQNLYENFLMSFPRKFQAKTHIYFWIQDSGIFLEAFAGKGKSNIRELDPNLELTSPIWRRRNFDSDTIYVAYKVTFNTN